MKLKINDTNASGMVGQFHKGIEALSKMILLIILIPISALGQSTDQNYIITKTYKEPTSSSIPSPSQEEAAQSITYHDGLGRPIQQIAHKQSGAGDDIIFHMEYDAYGRQVKEYLPIIEGQNLNYRAIDYTTVTGYYATAAFPGMAITGFPYSEKLFEASPLNRVLKQASPGDAWKMTSGHEVKFDYQTNATGEVRFFDADNSGLIDNSIYYVEHTLYKTITKNEDWVSGNNNTTEEFKDKERRVVLKRTYNNLVAHDTYYVYDDYGNLAYVLPPVVNLGATINNDVLDDVCYQYKYDYRNRLIQKKLPGKQWEYIAYNSQDMPVATGPAQSPWGENGWGWMITKYDEFGRVAYTGWIELDVNTTQREYFESQLVTGWSENYTTTLPATIDDVTTSYTNKTYPGVFKLLTINYYDNYIYPGAPTLPAEVEGEPVSTAVQSLTTGSWIRVLDKPTNTYANLSHTLYDSKGRPIRNHTTNYLEGYTTVDIQLDFVGKPIHTLTSHKRDAGSSEIMVKDTYEYTPQDRLLVHKQEIDGQDEELIVKNDYDDLGQLASKQVGGQDLTTYVGLQKVDFQYNIRGWLLGINNTTDLANGSDPLDMFAFAINYDSPITNNVGSAVIPLHNGSIAETSWRTTGDNILRRYGYSYDNLNRLTNSYYQKPEFTSPVTNMYNEKMSYDKNGNIQTMERNGDYDSDIYGEVKIDDLTYSYDTRKKNQLMKVTDGTNSPKGFKDDSNGTNDTTDDYDYDVNGNMVRDDNKSIDSISYNHLNLPIRIIFASGDEIKYLYNAAGQKVAKTVTVSSVDKVTDYLDGYQYTDGILNFFPHAEGYVNVTYCPECETKYQQRFNYVYQYKDHLGNIRLSYGYDQVEQTIKIIEENHYYPFGLKHTKYNTGKNQYEPDEENPELMELKQVPAGVEILNKYKYNGKEWQDELSLNLYDYGARNYDPALGRWMNIDPLAEQYRRWSPYNYAMNNPNFFIDPDGMGASPIIDEEGTLLGTDSEGYTGEAIVMDKADFKQGMEHSEALNSGTELSKYGEGINISDSTWDTIESNGGTTMTPTVENNGSQTAYYKPEGMKDGVDMNPGKDGTKSYPIGTGKDLYAPVDGVNTSAIPKDKVFKSPDGFNISIDKNGVPDIIGITENFIPKIGIVSPPDSDWKNLSNSIPNKKAPTNSAPVPNVSPTTLAPVKY
jgi:RHS repeat-associated protein